jgi:soluble lytic murein transglycosylase
VVEAEPDWYLRARYPLEYEAILRAHGRNYELDPALLAAVVYVESRFDPNAESAAGAVGLMQLLPDTAKGIALRTGGTRFVVADLRDPEINVRYGAWYLQHLLERYGDLELALAAYHAGQGNVDRWREEGSGIAFPETRAYVDDVLRVRTVYHRAYGPELRDR